MLMGAIFGGGASRPAPTPQPEPQPAPQEQPQPEPQANAAAGPTTTDEPGAASGPSGAGTSSAPPPARMQEAPGAGDDARRGVAAESLAAMTTRQSEAPAPDLAAIEAVEARAQAEAAVKAARQTAILDRAMVAGTRADTLRVTAAPAEAAPTVGDASPFSREVAAVRALEAPAPARMVDRRL